MRHQGIKGAWGLQRASIQLPNFCFHTTMSTTPSQSNEVITNAPSFRKLELFQADSDMEEEEDPEKIQQDAEECIMAVKIHNEKRRLEWEDWKWKEEEDWRMK